MLKRHESSVRPCYMTANTFHLNVTDGPQAPTAFANGPTMAQYQSDWIVDTLVKARDAGYVRVEAKPEVEEDWVKRVHAAWDITLFPKATGWQVVVLLTHVVLC